MLVANSTFRNNTAANGGALGALSRESRIYNSEFENTVLSYFGERSAVPLLSGL
jgi:hypothetical protein